jgi:hypothetical protein
MVHGAWLHGTRNCLRPRKVTDYAYAMTPRHGRQHVSSGVVTVDGDNVVILWQ